MSSENVQSGMRVEGSEKKMRKEDWLGVDFDKTLATYFEYSTTIEVGDPIVPMVNKVKEWLKRGIEVRIFTARVSEAGETSRNGVIHSPAYAAHQRSIVEKWSMTVFGQVLKVTCMKDANMMMLFDDKACGIVPNQGVRVDGRPWSI